MYAALTVFNLGGGMRATAEKLAIEFAPAFKSSKGCQGVTFLGNSETGDYASYSTWQTEEDLRSHLEHAEPKLEEALQSIGKSPPTTYVFEVFEPQA
jgi:heme-degrading monooxygenase HmoA